jgi:hypothetical protein
LSVDEHYVALPKLYGAPAYARPPRQETETPRPFDPDELPIEAFMTEEERAYAATLPDRDGRTARADDDADAMPTIEARPFSIRGLAGRILKQDGERKSA